MEWVVLLPVKAATVAKSRLAPAFDDPADLAAVVRAMRADTFAAIVATSAVRAVVVVVDGPDGAQEAAALVAESTPDRPAEDVSNGAGRFDAGRPGVEVLVQRSSGLNAALVEADAVATRHHPGLGRVAVVGDLPALTPGALTAVLTRAAGHPRAFVPDLEGTGTTMLAVTAGPLDPAFGVESAARHAGTAVRLDGLRAAAPAARRDVDVPADLLPADDDPPFGRRTAAELARLAPGRPRPDAGRSPAPGTIGACPTPT